MAHRKTIGVRPIKGGREINIPSVVKGKQVSQKEAEDSFFGTGKTGTLNRALGRKNSPNRKNVTKSFKNPAAATKFAKKESANFKKGRKPSK